MNPETIIAELRRINAWRRGDETIEQPEPEHFGDVLDAAAILIDQTDARCIELEERIEQMAAAWDKTKADLARVTAERDHWIALSKERNKTAAILEDTSIALRARVTEVEVQAERYRLATLRQDADLARVTAEREAEFRRSDSELAAAAQKESALRARVAKLDGWATDIRSHLRNKDKSLPTIQEVRDRLAKYHESEQRNAELVAALQSIAAGDGDERRRAEDALARAESATPAVVKDSEALERHRDTIGAGCYFHAARVAKNDSRYVLWILGKQLLPAGVSIAEARAARDAMVLRHGGDLTEGWEEREEQLEAATYSASATPDKQEVKS